MTFLEDETPGEFEPGRFERADEEVGVSPAVEDDREAVSFSVR
jgi:hypothetical protein